MKCSEDLLPVCEEWQNEIATYPSICHISSDFVVSDVFVVIVVVVNVLHKNFLLRKTEPENR